MKIKMKNKFQIKSLCFIGVLLVIFSCTKDVSSKPNFIHKPAPDKTAAAKLNGKVITKSELFKGIEAEIFEAEMKVYELKMNKLRSIVLEKMMEADPKKKGLTNDQYLDRYIAKNIKISKSDIQGFIKERKIPKQHINDQMKERIKKYLTMEKKKKAVESWLGQKTKKNPIEVFLAKPTRPVFEVKNIADAPSTGKEDAKVTLVEFSDFQCPFCAKGAKIVNTIKKKYGNKVKIVFKNYPLPFHNNAKDAAMAGLCAYEQGKDYFWKLHDKMFADQTKLTQDGLKAKARAVGVDVKKYESCMKSKKYTAKVEQDMKDGEDIGVKSTPTFFVNGKMVNGAQPIEVFEELINEGLKKSL